MDDAAVVRDDEKVQELVDDEEDLLLAQRPPPCRRALVRRRAAEQLPHHEEGVTLFVGVVVEHPHGRRVVDLVGDVAFAAEALGALGAPVLEVLTAPRMPLRCVPAYTAAMPPMWMEEMSRPLPPKCAADIRFRFIDG